MKVVRLKTEELREWRENRRHLVDDEGHLTGLVPPALEQALSTVMRSAQSQRKHLEQRVAVGRAPAQVEHLIRVEVQRRGIDVADIVLVATIDGQRIVTGREVLAAKMLHKHGECQLRAPNGVILKVVRDPGIHRPTFQESQQIAPKPEHCPCKAWGRPHPGTHYSTCPWNGAAPPDERSPDTRIDASEIQMLPTVAFESLRAKPMPTPQHTPMSARVDPRAVVVQAPQLDAPETCRNSCLSWATPAGFPVPLGQHHPTCMFAKDWAVKTARDTPRWLVDLRTGERVRHATNEEVGEADITARKTGSPIIHIEVSTGQSVPYAVVLETELDAEEKENAANGQSGQSGLPAAEPGVQVAPAIAPKASASAA